MITEKSVAHSSFTPEYSNELMKRVEDIYQNDVKHHFPQLRLTRLIDLLEHAAYLFETYAHFSQKGRNDDLLSAFIVGCYYMYLIIPQSTQFQTKNKSYSIYNQLKGLYQNETNMTNVLAMVKNEVDSILEKSLLEIEGIDRVIKRTRAYSLPDTKLVPQLAALNMNDNNSHFSQQATMNNNIPEESLQIYESIQNEPDDASPLWTAPPLEPNDQLKLALDQPFTHFSTQTPIEVASSVVNKMRDRSTSIEVRVPFPQSDDDAKHSSELFVGELPVDRSVTHRKDSYHSVYMLSGDNEEDNTEQFNFANSYIQSLDRLQKQNVITCPELFSILSNSTESQTLLLIDLRLPKQTKHNYIIAPNIIQIDPNILWNPVTNSPISTYSELEMVLKSPLLSQLQSFDYIVYYTDLKTFMNLNFDYNFTFFYLLVSSKVLNLKAVPTNLLGGFEKWKKVLRNYLREYSIKPEPFIYKPNIIDKPVGNISENKLQLKSPSGKPPEIPMRIRKSPPLPPKIELSPLIEQRSSVEFPKPYTNREPYISKVKSFDHVQLFPKESSINMQLTKAAAYSIPTIERNPNIYVSLSVTGLRNLGNTCYINSMLQCMFATRALRDLFVSSSFEKYMNKNIEVASNISKSFSILFKKMYLNGGCSVVPTGFLKMCNRLRPDLRIPDDQQDTQEFLMLMLDRLHDELSNQETVINDYPDLLLYDAEKLKVQQDEYKAWFENINIKNGLSPIDHIFQGQIENSLNCQRCGFSSYNYSSFYVLSLAIPKPSSATFSRSKRVKLEDCLNMFTSDEILSGENAWNCPKCGSSSQQSSDEAISQREYSSDTVEDLKHNRKSRLFMLPKKYSRSNRSLSPFRKHSSHKYPSDKWKSKKLVTLKSTNFITMPPVLVIHLSRFYYDMSKKNETIVTYPLVLNIVLKNDETAKYRLYAIVNHSGNLSGGHYTTLVNKEREHNLGKDRQKWYYFDDEVVKEEKNHGNIDEGIIKVSSSHVYVLFYEKIYD